MLLRPAVLSLVAGLALVVGCRARRARAPRPAAPRWVVAAAGGDAVRVRGGLVLKGALRGDNGRGAAAPYPATPIAATAQLADGTWRFAAVDGTLYRADTFTGALGVVGALPFRLEGAHAADGGHRRGVHSRGALAVIDDALGAHVVAPDGSSRPLRVGRALAVCFASPTEVYAVSEPGVLRVSRDGGAHFVVQRAPAGVPLAVWNADDDTLLRTTAGTFRLARGAFVPDPSAPSPSAWLTVPPAVEASLRDAADRLTVRLDPLRAVALSRGRVAQVRDRALELVDARTGRVLARDALPGDDCTLRAAHRGLRAVCRHDAWATLIAARDADRPGWTILRDEARAEPVGDVAFDDATPAWIVHAPCAQHPTRDPRALCLFDAGGAAHDLRLPEPATVIAMHRGVALALGPAVVDRAPTAYLLRADGVVTLPLPDDVRAPVLASWRDDRLTLAHAAAASPLALSTTLSPDAAPTWNRVVLPDGLDRAALTAEGDVLLFGADAGHLARARDLGHPRPLPSPVLGAGAALALDRDAPSFCVGPWCRLGGVLTLAPAPTAPTLVVARGDAPPPAPTAPGRPRGMRCEHGAVTRAPEIDRGAAVSGHAVQAALRGGALTVTWTGETARGSITRAVTARAGSVVSARGVQGATSPAALVALCSPGGCDHRLALATGLTELGLGRAREGDVEVQLRPGGYVVRVDDTRDGVALVTLVLVDASGVVTARRSFALAADRGAAQVGTWAGRDGLWVDERGEARFYALDPGDAASEAVATAPAVDARAAGCAVDDATGEARMIFGVPQVRGDGWFVEAGEWQVEAVIARGEGGACVRSITGGEARDEREAAGGREEREPVRSFALRATGRDTFEGRAWSGERAIALRCRWEE